MVSMFVSLRRVKRAEGVAIFLFQPSTAQTNELNCAEELIRKRWSRKVLPPLFHRISLLDSFSWGLTKC